MPAPTMEPTPMKTAPLTVMAALRPSVHRVHCCCPQRRSCRTPCSRDKPTVSHSAGTVVPDTPPSPAQGDRSWAFRDRRHKVTQRRLRVFDLRIGPLPARAKGFTRAGRCRQGCGALGVGSEGGCDDDDESAGATSVHER